MAVEMLPARALRQIEPIVTALYANYARFDPAIQAQVAGLYDSFRNDFPATGTAYTQGLVAVRFLTALDTIPAIRAVVGDLIDATRGGVTRGGSNVGDATLLRRLPPSLAPILPMTAAPAFVPQPAPAITRGEAPAAEPPSPAPASAPMPQLTRYPNLDCQDRAVLDEKFNVFVQLLRAAPTPSAAALSIADSDVPDQLPQLELVLRVRGFDIEGDETRTLTVLRDDDTEERVVLVPRKLGDQQIRADFYQFGRYIGTIRRNVTVGDGAIPNVAQPATPALTLCVTCNVPPPDLELCVELDRHDGKTLYFQLHSTKETINYNHAPMGQVTLQGSPLDKVQAVYDELTGFARATPDTPEAVADQQRRLARLGNQLWMELIPPELQAAYWKINDKVQTLQITSDEPWIPWEIVKPWRFDADNRRVDEPFLCEKFLVARWLAGPGPADSVPIQRVRPVVPDTTNLQSVQAELQYLEQIGQLRAGILADTPYSDCRRVIDLFENGSFSVLHFATHGSFDAATPDNSALTLSDGELRPSDIVAAFGGVRPRPLIFINACYGARTEFMITGLGGWAERLIRTVGVAAFIGTAWEVNDQLALIFAEEFYAALLRDGQSISQSFLTARRKIRDAQPGNSSWLAYVLYADPSAYAVVPSS